MYTVVIGLACINIGSDNFSCAKTGMSSTSIIICSHKSPLMLDLGHEQEGVLSSIGEQTPPFSQGLGSQMLISEKYQLTILSIIIVIYTPQFTCTNRWRGPYWILFFFITTVLA